jgi:cytochrome c oxidase subunit 4
MADGQKLAPIVLRPFLTWLALCIALAVTCAIAYLPLGWANLPIAMAIAGFKALLVTAIFMRLIEKEPLYRMAALAGPIWIFIMFVLMGAEYFTR